MMEMWERLQQVDVGDEERYLELFKKLINDVESGDYDFVDREGEDYYIINENRMDTKFVHIVPKELMGLFNEMKSKLPQDFLGFTVLVNKTIVSCFGIPCSVLSKAIIG